MFRISISMARVSPVVLALGATVLTGGGATAQAEDQERQSQLMTAADLGSGDPDRIRLALVKMSRMPVEEWSPELRETLFDALVREIGEETYGDDPHVAIYPMFNMVMQIAESGDVRAAPILVRHGGFGWDQLDLIVSFGEPGLRALLEFAPEALPFGIDDGTYLDRQRLLAALHLFVYEWGVEAFDDETLAQIRELAEEALAGPTHPGVLEWGAMGLALLVGGPESRLAVEEMAASDEAVRDRMLIPPESSGYTSRHEARRIEWVRKEAAYLLTDPKRTPYYRRPGCLPDGYQFPKPPNCRQ